MTERHLKAVPEFKDLYNCSLNSISFSYLAIHQIIDFTTQGLYLAVK